MADRGRSASASRRPHAHLGVRRGRQSGRIASSAGSSPCAAVRMALMSERGSLRLAAPDLQIVGTRIVAHRSAVGATAGGCSIAAIADGATRSPSRRTFGIWNFVLDDPVGQLHRGAYCGPAVPNTNLQSVVMSRFATQEPPGKPAGFLAGIYTPAARHGLAWGLSATNHFRSRLVRREPIPSVYLPTPNRPSAAWSTNSPKAGRSAG